MNQAAIKNNVSKLTQLKIRCMKMIMPIHVRRGFFILSLASYVLKQAQPDAILAGQLVTKLDLPSKPKVLLLAMNHNKSIWRKLDDNFNWGENYTTANVAAFIEEVIKNMPAWMTYSNPRLMRQDAIYTLRIARNYAMTA